jgi:hypothetical protein
MKRIFIIDGRHKEAPAFLKETPQIGSFVAYSSRMYKVTDVTYYFGGGEVHITLNHESD